jgi:hypothetical protein
MQKIIEALKAQQTALETIKAERLKAKAPVHHQMVALGGIATAIENLAASIESETPAPAPAAEPLEIAVAVSK